MKNENIICEKCGKELEWITTKREWICTNLDCEEDLI